MIASTSDRQGTTLAVTRLALLLGVSLLITGTINRGSLAADWPTFRGGNDRIGAGSEALPRNLAVQWKHHAPQAPTPAWPGAEDRIFEGKHLRERVKFDKVFDVAVVGDRVYFGSSVDHQLRCKDARSGQQLWTFYANGPIRLAPTVVDGRVLFGSDDGFVYCLAADSGKLLWKLRAGPADEWLIARGEIISRWPVRTGVLVDDGIAYFGAGIFPAEKVYLYAVRVDDGQIVWKRDNISEADVAREDLSPQGYLLANEETLFVPSGRSLPAAVARATGEILFQRTPAWRTEAGGVVGGTDALLADGQIYAAGEHHRLAMDQKTGKTGHGWFEGRELVVDGDDGFVATGTHVRRLHRADYAQASSQRQALNMEIYSLNRKISAKDKDSDAHRERVKEAQQELKDLEEVGIVWQTESNHDGSLLVTANALVSGGAGGVTAYDRETGEPIWSQELDGDVGGLALSHGRLLASTTAGSIYCFAEGTADVASSDSPATDPYPQDEWSEVYAQAAEQILNRSGARQGFCLVLGGEEGRLAYELAKRSDLTILCVEPDEEKVARGRKALTDAGLYGHRISILPSDLETVPYSNYFANLIVSDTLIRTGQMPGRAGDVARHLKPLGGVVCLGRPASAPGDKTDAAALNAWLDQMQLVGQAETRSEQGWALLERGALPGAGSWTHQYGEPGGTASSTDERIRGGLGVLWYGDPGPGKMVNRHDGAASPLSVGGRLFIQGETTVMAYDAYNGLLLWEIENPQAIRTGVFANHNPGNMAASDDRVFVMNRNQCLEIDAASGEIIAEHQLPEQFRGGNHEWGYVATSDGLLFGTATVRKEIEARAVRRGRQTEDSTDALFAIELGSGSHLWTFRGNSIAHHTIAHGPERVWFIDSSITDAQREALLQQDKSELRKLTGDDAREAEKQLKDLDVRLAVALDARSGNVLWAKPVDVTNCSEIGIGGGKLTLMYARDVLVLGGANANGHYWSQFLAGDFSRRRLVALSASTGEKLWARDANYRSRPIILEDRVIAEPWAYDLYTGQQLTRSHPLTGEQVPWSIMRAGHHCGMVVASPHMLMFRSGFTGFYDLVDDCGTQHFAGHRLGCWINAIPGNGLVMIPEASAGCVCLFTIASTVVLEPREEKLTWALVSSVGQTTPVRRMALNFGAPGDRRDARGTLWLSYPRPAPEKKTGLDLSLDVKHKLESGGKFTSLDSATEIARAEAPWIYSSQADGLTQCTIPLLGEEDAPARYKLRLHLAELDDEVEPGQRVFDVVVQGKPVLKDVDVRRAAEASHTAVVHEIDGVEVDSTLTIELVSHDGSRRPAVLSALEIQRVDD